MSGDRQPTDPHRDQPVERAGAALDDARAAAILVHGRGGSAQDILGLAGELGVDGFAWLAPQAAGHTWYPQSFLAPLEANEPFLGSAIARIGALVDEVEAAGVPAERIVLLGFSQGACLALETAARRARRFGALIALTGGLIGPRGTERAYPGSLDGTRVFLSSGDPDPHVPWWRVEETDEVLRGMSAQVNLARYPGRPHTIIADEIVQARAVLNQVVA